MNKEILIKRLQPAMKKDGTLQKKVQKRIVGRCANGNGAKNTSVPVGAFLWPLSRIRRKQL